MGEEQIRLVWKDAAETLFRLRIQAQTEKLASPAEVRKHRRTIARCQTILTQRGLLKKDASEAGGHHSARGDASSPQHEKHAKKDRESGRAKVHAAGKAGVQKRREFKKRTQSGT
jgi:large subunit ribosomal protein L29